MVKVQQLKRHDTVFWIPKHYWDKVHIIPDDSDKLAFDRDPKKPLVVIYHGCGDITAPCVVPAVRDSYSLLYADYYLSPTKEEHVNLTRLGKKSFYTGMAFSDFVMPEKRDPRLLVYVPDHGIPADGNKKRHFDNGVLSEDRLEQLMHEHGCDDYITSALVEDDRVHTYPNVLISDRIGDVAGHHEKCKYLYENAKVIYSEHPGTFSVVGKSMGIKTIGAEVKYKTLTDGNCRKRILEGLDAIISGRA
jgi:hypothetical protein